MSGDASAQDPSGRAELVFWTDVIVVEARFVVVSAAAEAEFTEGLSESAASGDADTTTAALVF